MNFSLFDVVALVQDVPGEQLRAGMVGAVVEIFAKPNLAYLVEFCDQSGRTIALSALLPEQLRLAEGDDLVPINGDAAPRHR